MSIKKSFKIVLDSTSLDSYSGTQYNANYYIDLSKVIRNREDYDKSYYVYCTFISETNTADTVDIITTILYTLTLKLSNKFNNIYQYTNNNNLYSFVLPIQVNPSDDSGQPDPHIGFFLQDKDQRPLFIENINNLTNINLCVLENGAPTTAIADYICILTFVEC
jgi:hypothetical protein